VLLAREGAFGGGALLVCAAKDSTAVGSLLVALGGGALLVCAAKDSAAVGALLLALGCAFAVALLACDAIALAFAFDGDTTCDAVAIISRGVGGAWASASRASRS